LSDEVTVSRRSPACVFVRLGAPIRIFQADNVVFLEVGATLHLDQFQRELAGIAEAMGCAWRNESLLVLLQEKHFVPECDFRGPLHNHPVLRAMIVLLERDLLAGINDDALDAETIALV